MRRRQLGKLALAAAVVACGEPAKSPDARGQRRSAMDLSSLGTMTIQMGSSTFMANVPAGTRLVIDFADVTIEGERLKAKKAAGSPAGDWLIIGPGDVATLDIRMLLRTHDGADVLMHGMGRTDSAKFSSGAPCWFTPLFETSDPRYAWLNKLQGVARGTASGKVVTFELAALV